MALSIKYCMIKYPASFLYMCSVHSQWSVNPYLKEVIWIIWGGDSEEKETTLKHCNGNLGSLIYKHKKWERKQSSILNPYWSTTPASCTCTIQ